MGLYDRPYMQRPLEPETVPTPRHLGGAATPSLSRPRTGWSGLTALFALHLAAIAVPWGSSVVDGAWVWKWERSQWLLDHSSAWLGTSVLLLLAALAAIQRPLRHPLLLAATLGLLPLVAASQGCLGRLVGRQWLGGLDWTRVADALVLYAFLCLLVALAAAVAGGRPAVRKAAGLAGFVAVVTYLAWPAASGEPVLWLDDLRRAYHSLKPATDDRLLVAALLRIADVLGHLLALCSAGVLLLCGARSGYGATAVAPVLGAGVGLGMLLTAAAAGLEADSGLGALAAGLFHLQLTLWVVPPFLLLPLLLHLGAVGRRAGRSGGFAR